MAELLCTPLWKLRSVVTFLLEFTKQQVKRLREMRVPARCLSCQLLKALSSGGGNHWPEALGQAAHRYRMTRTQEDSTVSKYTKDLQIELQETGTPH